MVEIYFEKELSDIVFDSDSLEEWKSLTVELGITAQVELAKGTKSPIPYPCMNEKMKRVARTLCPARTPLKDYGKTPIPLDVLRQAKFSINDKHFNKIEVWYDDKNPDPFLVGSINDYYGYINYNKSTIPIKDENGNTYFKTEEEFEKAKEYSLADHPGSTFDSKNRHLSSDKELYLIARWGDVLKDFKELTQMAISRCIEENSMKLRAEIAKLNEKLNTIKEQAPLYIGGDITEYDLKGSY